MYKPKEKASFSVLLTDGESNNALAVVRCLGEIKTIKISVLSTQSDAEVKYSKYVSEFIVNPKGDSKEGRLEAIKSAIKTTQAEILLPIDVVDIRLVSEYKEELSQLISIAPIPEVDSFDISDDKWLISLWLKENGVPHPDTFLVNSETTLEEILKSNSFPMIIKARGGPGGRGVVVPKNEEDLAKWYQEFHGVEDQIIQPFIRGFDIDCSVISVDGEIIAETIQKSLKDDNDSLWPYGLEFLEDEEILGLVRKVIKNFKWTGVVHIDLRYDLDEKKVVLIEMNPRYWASVTGSLFAGVNFPQLSCLVALNQEIPEINKNDTKVFRIGAAFKSSIKNLAGIGEKTSYDHSYLELIVKDLKPTLLGGFRSYIKKFKN